MFGSSDAGSGELINTTNASTNHTSTSAEVQQCRFLTSTPPLTPVGTNTRADPDATTSSPIPQRQPPSTPRVKRAGRSPSFSPGRLAKSASPPRQQNKERSRTASLTRRRLRCKSSAPPWSHWQRSVNASAEALMAARNTTEDQNIQAPPSRGRTSVPTAPAGGSKKPKPEVPNRISQPSRSDAC